LRTVAEGNKETHAVLALELISGPYSVFFIKYRK
jgi:hypothetical protein